MTSVHDFTVNDIGGNAVPLATYRGKVLLIVNTASQCGFTPQYAPLQTLYENLRERGLIVLGFPCNQFGGQEPGSNDEVKTFCETQYSVTFPMFEKIEVNGPKTAPLYTHLKDAAPGLLGSKRIKWNFTKFLVDKDGKVIKRYATMTKPQQIASDVERLLA